MAPCIAQFIARPQVQAQAQASQPLRRARPKPRRCPLHLLQDGVFARRRHGHFESFEFTAEPCDVHGYAYCRSSRRHFSGCAHSTRAGFGRQGTCQRSDCLRHCDVLVIDLRRLLARFRFSGKRGRGSSYSNSAGRHRLVWRWHQGAQGVERCGGGASVTCEGQALAELRGCTEVLLAAEANLQVEKTDIEKKQIRIRKQSTRQHIS